jgi:hypothetical protein
VVISTGKQKKLTPKPVSVPLCPPKQSHVTRTEAGCARKKPASKSWNEQTPWPEPASELYRPSDRSLSTKLVPTLADRGCCLVSTVVHYGRVFGFLDWSRYFFFQVAPQLYSRGWVDPDPDPLLLRKSGSAENRTKSHWIYGQEFWPLDHRGGLLSCT